MEDFWYDYDIEDVSPCCSNCEYEGEEYTCKCKQREKDVKSGCEVKNEAGSCAYFEVERSIID